MANYRAKLPPVNSLVAFEAAARHLNFTHAAKELRVTQAAVSRQVSILEDHLGFSVFNRLSRGLALTGEGLRLQRAVTLGLEHIANAVADLRRRRGTDELTVATSVTFANYWLMSRLAKFRAANPDIDLRLVASAPVRDLTAAGIDLAIRYGSGHWRDIEAVHLLDNEVFPVCAPAYLERCGPLNTASDLLDKTLLHLDEYDHNWVTWEQWLKSVGINSQPTGNSISFDNYMVLVQAALNGEGIALGGGRLADDFLAGGALVRPIGATLRSDRSFHLLIPSDVPMSPQAARFKDWILHEAGIAEQATRPAQATERCQ